MKTDKILDHFKKNIFLTLCFISLLSLCVYQTWLRGKENSQIKELDRKVAASQDGRNLFERLQFSPGAIDSLHTLKKDKLLVLRFVRNDCKECVDSIFSNLSAIGNKIGRENIAVLVDEPNLSAYYRYRRLNQEKITNFFYCPTKVSTVDEQGISYYAIYSRRSGYASFVFLTRPTDFPAQTNNYLRGIQNVF